MRWFGGRGCLTPTGAHTRRPYKNRAVPPVTRHPRFFAALKNDYGLVKAARGDESGAVWGRLWQAGVWHDGVIPFPTPKRAPTRDAPTKGHGVRRYFHSNRAVPPVTRHPRFFAARKNDYGLVKAARGDENWAVWSRIWYAGVWHDGLIPFPTPNGRPHPNAPTKGHGVRRYFHSNDTNDRRAGLRSGMTDEGRNDGVVISVESPVG